MNCTGVANTSCTVASIKNLPTLVIIPSECSSIASSSGKDSSADSSSRRRCPRISASLATFSRSISRWFSILCASKPSFFTLSWISAMLKSALLYSTLAFSAARFTTALATAGILSRAFSIRAEHAAQLIPVILSSTLSSISRKPSCSIFAANSFSPTCAGS